MSKIIDDAFQDGSSEGEMSHRIARLQEIVCYLVHRNQELSQTVRELTSSQAQTEQKTEEV